MGYATEAVKGAMRLAFYDLHLHRVFARVMPENKASIYLLESIGFQYEGVERGCFLIQNRWEDHLRYAYLNPSDESSSIKRYQQPNRFSTCSGINSGNPKMIAITRS